VRRARPASLVFAALAGGAAALAGAEAFVARARLDMTLLGPLLYYQGAQLPVHRVSGSAALHYELRPGAREEDAPSRTVTINSLGFRGPERTVRKPDGTFRVICFGGSNTFGALVGDGETYPARLEAELNRELPGRFEVWNAGVDAYVLMQNAAAAGRALREYSPDLLIFQVSNCGRRPFLAGQPYERYFREDPGLYAENLRWPKAGGPRLHQELMRRSALYRSVVIALNRKIRPGNPFLCNAYNEARNSSALVELAAEAKGTAPAVLLLHPGFNEDPPGVVRSRPPGYALDPELRSSGLPVIDLKGDLSPEQGPEFGLIHPPAPVYAWYAKRIAAHLRDEKLVPRRVRAARGAIP
jgi:hypothetical protein